MSNDSIVSAQNLSKAYRIWDRPSSRLLAPTMEGLASLLPNASTPAAFLRGRAHQHYRDFYALSDVSFELPRGAALGIIGRNGSGKSTLLQMLAGTLQPTRGQCTVRGRVAALLELGSGFNPEFSGRENVILNGTVLGLTREEIESRFDAIVAFADIGDFLDQPVKTYSSGMMVRLAFSVAVCVEPDVLIVDEALSVGDIFFQQKCFERIRAILSRGTTLLFVTHDVPAVQNLCARALLLDRGQVVFDGTPAEAATRYYALATSGKDKRASVPRPNRQLAAAQIPSGPSLRQFIAEHNILPQARSRFGEQRTVVRGAAIISSGGINALDTTVDEMIDILYHIEALVPVERASFGLHLYDGMKECIFAAGARNLAAPLHNLEPGQSLCARYRLRLSVAPGQYTLSLGCSAHAPPVDGNPNIGVVDDRHEGIGPLTVNWNMERLMPFYGKARLETRIDYLEPDAAVPADLLRGQP